MKPGEIVIYNGEEREIRGLHCIVNKCGESRVVELYLGDGIYAAPKEIKIPRGKSLGELIVWHRQILGMTQEELAQKVGASRSVINKYEKNASSPKLFEALRLADTLGVGLEYLARGGDTL